jgi:hypothetical protein
MSIPNLVVYRKVDDRRYWNLPEEDITQQIYDEMTPSQRRELRAAPGFEAVDPPKLDQMTREELEAFAESIAFPGPYDRYETKADLITAFGGDPGEPEVTTTQPPVTPKRSAAAATTPPPDSGNGPAVTTTEEGA